MTDRTNVDPPVSDQPKRPFPWRLVAGALLIVLIIVFLLENTRRVAIRFVGPEVKAPLIVALLIAALLGAGATLLIQYHRNRSRSGR